MEIVKAIMYAMVYWFTVLIVGNIWNELQNKRYIHDNSNDEIVS